MRDATIIRGHIKSYRASRLNVSFILTFVPKRGELGFENFLSLYINYIELHFHNLKVSGIACL